MDWIADAVYEIVYKNREGLKTRRIIRVIETILIKRNDTTVYIRAFCYLRNEDRTFREDRIASARLIAKQEAGSSEFFTARNDSPTMHSECPCESTARRNECIKPISSDTNQEGSYQPESNVSLVLEGSVPLSIGYRKASKVAPYANDYYQRDLSFISQEHSKGKPGKSIFQRIIGIVVAAIIGSILIYGIDNLSSNQTQGYSSTKTTPLAQHPVQPSLEEVKLGGCILRIHRDSTGTWYEVPARGYTGTDKVKAVMSIRVPNFINYTGIKDSALIAKYLAADSDGNGKLSYTELEYFAAKQRTYVTYKNNETALRPDRFLAEGGGDCEDFALYIAGLLRFWGWQPYIACFNLPHGSGHAVCFSFEGSGGFPRGYEYYTLSGKTTWDGTALPDGKYIAIDYENVGRLSNAVGEDWTLNDIFIPEKIWGIRM